jgi:hypothetical protein
MEIKVIIIFVRQYKLQSLAVQSMLKGKGSFIFGEQVVIYELRQPREVCIAS